MKIKLLILFITTLLAYGLTIKMFVWQDDHAVAFKLQNIDLSSGQFGSGIYDPGSAYRGVILFLYPIYQLFGMNTAAFYLAGILVYFVSSLSVYLLVRTLTKDITLAFASAFIYASGNIGGETLWRIFNSIHTSVAVTIICLSLASYKLHADLNNFRKKVVLYVASLILFYLAIELGFVRAHGIVFGIIAVEILWNLNIWKSIFRLTPFLVTYYRFYIYNNSAGHELQILTTNILRDQRLDFMYYPLKNLENIIIPDTFGIPLGIFLLATCILFIKSRNKKIVAFSLLFALSSYLVYYIHTPTQIFSSIHRYFSVSLVGSSLFISLAIKQMTSKKNYSLVTSLIVIVNLYLVNTQHIFFLENITYPSRNFFSKLLVELPEIEKGSIVYFDVKDDKESKEKFNNFFGVGSMPDTTAIAWQYGIDRYDFFMPQTYDRLVSTLKENQIDSGKIHFFYYSAQEGLQNTTNILQNSIRSNKKVSLSKELTNLNIEYVTALNLNLMIDASLDFKHVIPNNKLNIDLKQYLTYLSSKNNYYLTTKLNSSTFWEDNEESNLIDEDITTNWIGDRIVWSQKNIEEIVFDLDQKKEVSGIKLSHNYRNSTPTHYKVYCTYDAQPWKLLGNFYYSPLVENSSITNSFPSTSCKQLKIEILETLGNDSPRLSEIEIIESPFINLDFHLARRIEENPFDYLVSDSDITIVQDYIESNPIKASICYKTNKSDKPYCSTMPLFLNSIKSYSMNLPPNGTILESIVINVPPQIKYIVNSAEIEYRNIESF